MAASPAFHFFLLLSLFLSLSFSFAFKPHLKPLKPHAFFFPIHKDPSTLQYSTSVEMGTPNVTLDLVIDLRERFLWFECGQTYNSTTYKPVHCGTTLCKIAKGTDCNDCTNHPLKTGCTNNTCGNQPYNPFGGYFVSGDLGQDIMSSVCSTSKDNNNNGAKSSLSDISVPNFISSCVYPDKFGIEGFLGGLAKGNVENKQVPH